MYDVCMYVQILAVCWTNVVWRLLALFVITTLLVLYLSVFRASVFSIYIF